MWALGEIGPPAKDAIPLLEQQLRHEDQTVRIEASKVIRRIRPNRP
jgi:HEAT repeat protein